ncbi:hypothetical protein [Candidatus Halobonum tyrrellensis]|uniref:hypothetical protein n=1 Tax=Candidatus Halobonum tyrrellensis TaxID=1431545 RepID=UPI00126930EB|nr:hypothetical protein [Candidatus Halobonum tyrrellensis]
MGESAEEFNYEGRLVFNQLYHLRSENGEATNKDLLSNLSSYQGGTPDNPGEGFDIVDLDRYDQDLITNLSSDTRDITYLQYKREDYTREELVNNQGEIEEVFMKNVNTADIFLVNSEFLIFRGSERITQSARENIKGVASDNFIFDEIDFSSDFLVWMIYLHNNGKAFSDKLRVERFTDAKLTGNRDIGDSTRRISGSTEIMRSAPVATAILQGKNLDTLGGYFIYEDIYHIASDISDNGRIHVKSRADIQHSSDLKRMVISVLFVSEILYISKKWMDMDPRDKYPPDSFFESILAGLEARGLSLGFSLDSITRKYKEKRREK